MKTAEDCIYSLLSSVVIVCGYNLGFYFACLLYKSLYYIVSWFLCYVISLLTLSHLVHWSCDQGLMSAVPQCPCHS